VYYLVDVERQKENENVTEENTSHQASAEEVAFLPEEKNGFLVDMKMYMIM